MSKTFCPLPWISVAMRNNGDLRVCPQSMASRGKGLAHKPEGGPYNAGRDSFQDYRNSELLKSIRAAMLEGQWPENCVRCQRETESGVRAAVEYERQLRSHIITAEQARQWTAPDGTIAPEQVPLALLDVRFGNQCNLACRTCNPTESSAWYSDYQKLHGDTFKFGEHTLQLRRDKQERLHLGQNFFDWYENPEFFAHLSATLKNVQQIHMSGGEPLKIKSHLDFLKRLIDLDYHRQISLEYNTNGFVIPDEVWELWDQFKQVKIGLSIDGFGPMNDYIRYPSRWALLEKNIARLDQTKDHFLIWFTFTVHAYNIYYLPEIITWRLRSPLKKVNNFVENAIFSDHPVHNPPHLNIQIFPEPIKLKILQRWDRFKEELPGILDATEDSRRVAGRTEVLRQVHQLLDSYSAFMMRTDKSEYYPKFLSYTDKLDLLRGESFAQVFPEFHQMLI